jgi:hypothetical protein
MKTYTAIIEVDEDSLLQKREDESDLLEDVIVSEFEGLKQQGIFLASLEEFYPAKVVVLGWSAEDVINVRKDLTEEQAIKVINHMQRHADASLGVTWDTLIAFAEDLFPNPDYDADDCEEEETCPLCGEGHIDYVMEDNDDNDCYDEVPQCSNPDCPSR